MERHRKLPKLKSESKVVSVKNSIRIKALLLTLLFIHELFAPTALYALTSGPSQPEFSSFEPVATTQMVNNLTGDFTYNIPLLEVPGPGGSSYPVSLSYHSGIQVEQEASWVGLGFTLNSGAVNRIKRGLADDWKGETVKSYNRSIPNRTVTLGGRISGEIASIDIPYGGDASLRYNNYRGFGYTAGLNASTTDGLVTLGFHLQDGEGTFNVRINPAGLLNRNMVKQLRKIKKELKENHNDTDGLLHSLTFLAGTKDALRLRKEKQQRNHRKDTQKLQFLMDPRPFHFIPAPRCVIKLDSFQLLLRS